MIGEKILQYTLDEEIGSGGFGTVYKVSKTNASGTYIRALKHISFPSKKQYEDVLNSMGGDYSNTDEYFAGVLNGIVTEIKIISTLSEMGAQNIVRYYENDIVESYDYPKKYDIYILMEYLTPFPNYRDQNEMCVKDVIKLGKDILTALISCHERNIIHRDIKDDNIFVSADGAYKLGDFGVSKILKERSGAGSMKGTPSFIAPEVFFGNSQYDATVDIYSLGIVLYKLLNRARNPFMPEFPQVFNSNDEDIAFKRRMHGETPDLPLEAKNELGQVIVKAISRREYRYNSAKEFLEALIDAEKRLGPGSLLKVINPRMKPRVQMEVEETFIPEATIGIFGDGGLGEIPDPIPPQPPKKKKWWIILLILLLLLFGIGAVIFAFAGDDKDDQETNYQSNVVTEAPKEEKPTQTPTVAPTPTSKPTVTPTMTPRPTPTEAPSATPEPTLEPSPTPTVEPTATATPVATKPAPTKKPTPTPKPKHTHTWLPATCDKPQTCRECNATKNEALGHDYGDWKCEVRNTCKRCGATAPEITKHKWKPATATKPQTCVYCGATKGEPVKDGSLVKK